MDIGFTKILLFGMIALIVLGPEKLPHAVRTAGRYYAKFRRTVSTIQHEIEAELNLAEARQQMQEELAKIRQTETDIRREMEKLRSSVSELQQSHPLAEQNPLVEKSGIEKSLASNQDSPSQDNLANATTNPAVQTAAITQPMYYRWFLLSDYDKARRLPKPPFLPNYHADTLLFSGQNPC